MIPRFRLSLFVLAALAGPWSAAPALAQERAPIQLGLDVVSFAYDADESLVELSFSFGASSLAYERQDDAFLAAVPARLTFRPTAANAPGGASTAPVEEEEVEFQFSVPDTAALEDGQYFVQQVRMAVPPGEYALEVAVAEVDDRPSFRIETDVLVPDFTAAGRAMVSGVTLASSIVPNAPEDDPFYKNGLSIRPNPDGIYGAQAPRLFYYAETYGVPAVQQGETYTVLTYVSRSDGPAPLDGFERRVERPLRSPDALVGQFDVSTLPSGSYFLRFALLNEQNEALAEQSTKFFVLNPGVATPALALGEGSFEENLYATMAPEEIEENLEHARVIATSSEMSRLRQARDLEAKREFLAGFWQARDTDSNPSTNTARRVFYERLDYVRSRYNEAGLAPFETDRGRVILKYGMPSNVDPRPFERDLAPHEIWTYENIPGQGQALFVFGDVTRSGRFDLIHATVTGEITTPDWERQLRR